MRPDRQPASEALSEAEVAPCVSVVLPTHNRPGWLADALTSVLDGSFGDIEVIVSNNGDPLHTRRLRSQVTDSRIRWVEQDRETSDLQHFRAALGLARGRYVAVLHDDDVWCPDFLAALVPPLERHPEAVVAFCDHYLIDASGEVDLADTERQGVTSGRRGLAPGVHRPFFDLLARQTIPFLACVWRREALPPAALPDAVAGCYDVWGAYVLAGTGGGAYYEPRRLMRYRVHPGMMTARGKISGSNLGAINCRSYMLRDVRLAPYRALLSARLARDHEWVGGRLLREGARRQGRAHLVSAIRLRPTAKALAGWSASWLVPQFLLTRL